MPQAITYSSYSILEPHIISYYLLPFVSFTRICHETDVVMGLLYTGQVVPLATKDWFSCQNFLQSFKKKMSLTTYFESTLFFSHPLLCLRFQKFIFTVLRYSVGEIDAANALYHSSVRTTSRNIHPHNLVY